jgi:exoribonuclease-2
MAIKSIVVDSLVVYKTHPARVLSVGDKLTIALENGDLENVRYKDVELLHPGPFDDFEALHDVAGEVELAWEVMLEDEGESSNTLVSLAELAFGEYSPASAWSTWKLIKDGLYFQGSIEAIRPRSKDEVQAEIESRRVKAAEIKAWDSFLERIKNGEGITDEDKHFLDEVEKLAYGRVKHSKLLRELGRSQSPQSAHALLLELGYWDSSVNPYPRRLQISSAPTEVELPGIAEERRLDLTQLNSYAIDDRDNLDPDDAISLEELELENGEFAGGRLWVHIADAAALVPANSPLDLEARARASTCYLPEGMLSMLPDNLIRSLGMGLNETSPALSFGITLNREAEIADVEIAPSIVHVQRMSYEEAEGRLEDKPLSDLLILTRAYCGRREANEASFFDMPEVKVIVQDGVVDIRPLPELASRSLVREAMLMAGEAAAGYASANDIPFPFVIQEAPDEERLVDRLRGETPSPGTLAHKYALRRISQRSQVRVKPSPHAGVGLLNYSRVTSPLRRYLDLAAHQQLRGFLAGVEIMDESDMLERIGASQAVTGSVNQADWLSRRHWTLVYLEQNQNWTGEGVLVEKRGLSGKVIIPQLAFETQIHMREDKPLNSVLELSLKGINLPELEAYFQVVK